MPRHSSYRSNHGIDSGGSDWSSSQLIIGIAVAIVFGVTCFATGYVIARYDNPLEPVAANTPDGGQPEAAVEPPVPAPVPAPAEGNAATPTPTAPANSVAPGVAPAPSAPEPAKPSDTIQRTGLRPTTIGALPEPGGPTPMVRTNVDLSKAPTPEIEPMDPDESTTVPGITPPAPATATTTTPGTVPSITPPTTTTAAPPTATTPVKVAAVTPPAEKTPEKPVDKPVEKPAPEITPPPAKPPVVTPPPAKPAEKDEPTVSKGSFGIQVASFDGPQRSTQAKEVQSNLKTKAQQNADIKVTADGTYHKVVITGFSTREAAKAACEKMKGKPGLEGAWVVRLSE